MNNIYKVIWSKAKNCYVVASEIARSHTKSASGSEKIGGVTRRSLLASLMALSLLCGGLGVAGATLEVLNQSGTTGAVKIYTKEEVDNALKEKGLATDVATNKANIAKLQEDVGNATSGLTQKVTEQGKKIATNTANIAKNADNITKLENNKADKTALGEYAKTADVYSKTDAEGKFATNDALNALKDTVNGKADAATVTTALGDKANTDLSNLTDDGKTKIKETMSADMAKKADKTYVDNALDNKADKTVVTALVGRVGNLETTVSDHSNGLVKKVADLNEKTTKITYDAALGTKVDGVTFNAGEVTGVTSINGIDIGDAQVDMKGKNLTGVETINGTKIGNQEGGEYISQDGSIWGNLKTVDGQMKKNADNIETNKNSIATLDTKVGKIDDRTGGIKRNTEGTKTTTIIENKVTVDNSGNVGGVKGLSAETITTGKADIGALNVTGESSLNNTKVDGTLGVTGATTLDGALTVKGESSLNNTKVDGTLGVTGATTLDGTLTANGEATFKKKVTMKDELDVTDTAGDKNAKLSVKAEEGVKASATDGTTTGSLDVKGDKVESFVKDGDKENTVTSTADGTTFKNSKAAAPVTGASGAGTAVNTKIKGNTITTGGVTMDYADVMKDLGVKGNTTLGEAGKDTTLIVNSKATFNNGLTVTNGETTLKNTTIEGTLNVSENAIFQKDVTANSFSVNGKTYIDSDGLNANNQVIRNVADGSISEGSKDAVNGGQLYGVKRDLEHQVDKVGANAAAMANLRPMEFDPDSKWNIAAAIGNYGSETAAALGAFYRPNDDVMVNLSTAFGTGENMVGGGVSVRLGKGGNKLSREESNALKDQVNDLTARMDALLSVLNPNMSKDFPDVPENHWAYEAVSRLAGNDIVQGYPDGEFHGERTMTRYEMAEIIYNALSRGAEAEKELVEEFKPELQAMAASEKATAERAEG